MFRLRRKLIQLQLTSERVNSADEKTCKIQNTPLLLTPVTFRFIVAGFAVGADETVRGTKCSVTIVKNVVVDHFRTERVVFTSLVNA